MEELTGGMAIGIGRASVWGPGISSWSSDGWRAMGLLELFDEFMKKWND